MKKDKMKLTTLGKSGAKWAGYETFLKPLNCTRVTCISDEITAVCPITDQPDFYCVKIDYVPRERCIESKSLKLGLQRFRNEGHFCEKFADILCKELCEALESLAIRVTVIQKPRGGIAIHSVSTIVSQESQRDESYWQLVEQWRLFSV